MRRLSSTGKANLFILTLDISLMQIEDEIAQLFDFMGRIYRMFLFELSLVLSTQLDNYIGSTKTQDIAEQVSFASCLVLDS
jgi:threonyl-tRNA synthetase